MTGVRGTDTPVNFGDIGASYVTDMESLNMNLQDFKKMVSQLAEDKLKEAAENEANRIVADTLRRVGAPDVSPRPAIDASNRPGRIRNRNVSRHQFAPKGSWLALAPRASRPAVKLTGQLEKALAVADATLGSGPAERSVITKLMVDANPGWTRVTASGCISRLVAGGRLVVVKQPQAAKTH